MNKKLRVLALMHTELVPPDDLAGLTEKEVGPFKTEYDVVAALQWLKHDVRKLGVSDELAPLRNVLQEWSPHIVFNILEEFHGQPVYDQNVVSYLELMHTPYTGCNPRGMVLARDKALSKKILHYHRIRVPRFAVVPLGRKLRRPKHLEFPLIVKSLIEEASMGISQASVVGSDEKLAERIQFIHEKVRTDVIVEQYINGRELNVGVLGNRLLKVLPVWELKFKSLPTDALPIATRKVKWDLDMQEKWGVAIEKAKNLPEPVIRKIDNLCKRIYRLLGLTGYARIDFRLSPEGDLYFLEANPNPDIARDEEFASAAAASGLPYEKLIQKMLNLGLQRSTGN
jgi:D-alanine-D-alanine ligase